MTKIFFGILFSLFYPLLFSFREIERRRMVSNNCVQGLIFFIKSEKPFFKNHYQNCVFLYEMENINRNSNNSAVQIMAFSRSPKLEDNLAEDKIHPSKVDKNIIGVLKMQNNLWCTI